MAAKPQLRIAALSGRGTIEFSGIHEAYMHSGQSPEFWQDNTIPTTLSFILCNYYNVVISIHH
jgi:hypothetical protein